MKLSTKQELDLKTVQYFIPQVMKNIPISEKDIEMFFDWSERGKHKDLVSPIKMDGFNALIQGKEWRGVHMRMFEEGIMEGSMPYMTILTKDVKIKRKWWQLLKPLYRTEARPIEKSTVDFMAKEMFKGIDKEVIYNAYSTLLYNAYITLVDN